jgi:hypothetical protein
VEVLIYLGGNPVEKNRLLLGVIALAGLVVVSQAAPMARAQDQPPDQAQVQAQTQDQNQDQGQDQAPAQDPPGRVARLDYSNGSVSFQPGGEGDWVTAVNNRPLTTGDNLWADKDSRAEVQIGSTSIRMDSETSLTFLDLDDQTTQLKLSMGTLILRVRHLDDGDTFEVDTPNLAFAIQSIGEYRIDVDANGDQTLTTVWRGRGEVTGGGASYDVIAGQQATFNGTDQLDHQIAQVPGSDDFDNFAFSRDRGEDQADSANYISTEMTGYEDLDDNGSWSYAADYGPVWTPAAVAVGWAPYRFGHWAFVEPWGWTWVEDEPWGFAPFHYGRWAFVGARWSWVPGPIVVRPIYAPALVAFVGGGGFSFSFGAGVGWFPLGPREVFVPWYRTSRVYVNNVNITNTRVNIAQVNNFYNLRTGNRVTYVNQHVNNAVTVVSHDTFVNARPVARNLAQVDARQLAEAPVTRDPQIKPAKTSLMGAGEPARARPPAAVVNRRVIATRTPAPPKAPFEQRQAAMNVRTETPGTPQPPVRQSEPRPQGNPRLVEQGTPPPAEGTVRQTPPSMQRAVPRPPTTTENGQTHPLVRTAPPVEERPEQQKSEEQKFNNWQRQRPAPAPRPAEKSSPPPHEEKSHK